MLRFALTVFLLLAAAPAYAGDIETVSFGRTAKGVPVERVVMTNDHGMRVALITYGATVTEIVVPDRRRVRRNVVLSLPDMPAYERSTRRWGGIVGRYAGRIADASFPLDGVVHRLEPGRNGVTLHGGSDGYDKRVWSVTTRRDARALSAIFTLVSPAGDQGFPGTLAVQVTYRLMRRSNTLAIDYRATTTAATPFNPTNHMFLNLSGAGAGTIGAHRLRILSERFSETDPRKIPTGRLLPVAGTPLDFRTARPIDPLAQRRHPMLVDSNGFDHAYVTRSSVSSTPRAVAMLDDPASGRRVTIASTEPALIFNSGNGFDGSEVGSEGVAYPIYAGVALEAQHLSNSPNQPAFPTTVVRPDRAFTSTTEYRFSTTR